MRVSVDVEVFVVVVVCGGSSCCKNKALWLFSG